MKKIYTPLLALLLLSACTSKIYLEQAKITIKSPLITEALDTSENNEGSLAAYSFNPNLEEMDFDSILFYMEEPSGILAGTAYPVEGKDGRNYTAEGPAKCGEGYCLAKYTVYLRENTVRCDIFVRIPYALKDSSKDTIDNLFNELSLTEK